ncbi:hypothetical protein J7T55_009970 [Diaporthe amygdali]|uniref:uncharacterized protein n=1 Tax=Phomopsis amygdali TaxID=1214568 RepID=UPI0022FDDCAC|nr:uncharacterized protein J7T55_009970 [Diaporthe amygdali]KAJ0116819.1 hypothetical protein J7T55_009970 [Diaporthe amygdali]
MGKKSRQVENEAGGFQQHAGRTASDRDEFSVEIGRTIGPQWSDLESDGDNHQPNPASNPPQPAKHKKRRRKSSDSDAVNQQLAADMAAMADNNGETVPESLKKSKKKKKKSRKTSDEAGDNGSVASVESLAHNGHIEDRSKSKKKSKKRSKMAAIAEQDVPEPNDANESDLPQDNALLNGEPLPNGNYHPEPEVLQSPQSTPKKKKSKHKKHRDVQSPDAQQTLVSHALGGSPPSAQQPLVNGVASHNPALEADAADQEVIPASQASESPRRRRSSATESLRSEMEAHDLKIEPESDLDDIEDNELPFAIAKIIHDDRGYDDESAHNRDHLRQKSPFMHKQQMSIIDDRPELDGDDEEPLSDLLPSQIKPEQLSSESESDLGSPSVARLGRLERSRSRSISRAPAAMQSANENFHAAQQASHLGLASRSSPSRSSTGSNESIPARIQVRPDAEGSASLSRSGTSGRDEAQLNGDAMDLDDQDSGDGYVSPPKKQTKQPKSARKPTRNLQVNGITAEAAGADEGPGEPASSRKRTTQKGRQHQTEDAMSNLDANVRANWLAQPGRRRPHADVVEESDHDGADESVVTTRDPVQDTAQDEVEGASQVELPGRALAPETEAPAQEEPEVSASQPKKHKKRRRLQSKESLSLSQLEDDSGEGESQSRLSLKLKDVMRGDVNNPEDGEPATSHEPSQEPTLPKPTKPKRKRRSNNVSEDEMENLLAGPARRKKSRKATNGRGLSKSRAPVDDENTTATNRKRVPRGEVATGPWTSEELNALGQVVDQFCRAYDKNQSELNAMIHLRPDMSNPMHKEFWDSAVTAIPQRNRKQIVERTRRLYHNFAGRGQWTDEQKEELHDLFEKHGNKFSLIAQLINRDQKDIRDYWRNSYLVHAHQHKSRWKPDETETLRNAVEEALHKIRIDRENNDQFRPRPRAKGFDDESLLDWQQISTAMGLTRNRQQCKWKWQDLKDKGVAGAENDHLPKAPREPRNVNGLSEELANAREDYRGMSVEDQLRIVEAIHDSGVTSDSKIRWASLVDERFRAKWRRPTLKLVWFRLRKTVPDYEEQDVPTNARYLLNYYNIHQSLPRLDDHQADDQTEEKLVKSAPGSKVWRTPSQEPRAVRERQRRSSSASSRASSQRVSGEILRIEGIDDEHSGPVHRGRDPRPRSDSIDLGQEDHEGAGEPQSTKGKQKGSRKKNKEDAVPIRIPKHLKGEAAEKAQAEANSKQDASAGSSKAKNKGKGKKGAKSPTSPARGQRSASVAIDSDSE